MIGIFCHGQSLENHIARWHLEPDNDMAQQLKEAQDLLALQDLEWNVLVDKHNTITDNFDKEVKDHENTLQDHQATLQNRQVLQDKYDKFKEKFERLSKKYTDLQSHHQDLKDNGATHRKRIGELSARGAAPGVKDIVRHPFGTTNYANPSTRFGGEDDFVDKPAVTNSRAAIFDDAAYVPTSRRQPLTAAALNTAIPTAAPPPHPLQEAQRIAGILPVNKQHVLNHRHMSESPSLSASAQSTFGRSDRVADPEDYRDQQDNTVLSRFINACTLKLSVSYSHWAPEAQVVYVVSKTKDLAWQ